MKKSFAALCLSLLMIFSFITAAFAAGNTEENTVLKFGEDGKFGILYVCDIQDLYPIHETSTGFINAMIDKYKPDLVILGGDNTVAPYEQKEDAVKEICNLFINKDVPFTLVFGNHDRQQDYENDALLELYQKHGGEYCLAFDECADPNTEGGGEKGAGTHHLVVKDSKGEKPAYNLYMFDSHSTGYSPTGEDMGYGCVNTTQIEWYKKTSAELKEENGGITVPAMAFQHIIVQEIYDALYTKMPNMGKLTRNYDGVSYSLLPNLTKLKDGFVYECPCPGYYNYGQFDAMKETGDVTAIFSGHDHINTFTVEKDGIDIVNTPGCTYHSYGNQITRGCRYIELDENELQSDPRAYKSEVMTISEYVMGDGKDLVKHGDINMFEAFFSVLIKKSTDAFVSVLNFFNF